MLYGYGDDRNPYTETVDFLEDLVMEFIIEMTHNAMDIGRTGRVQVRAGKVGLFVNKSTLHAQLTSTVAKYTNTTLKLLISRAASLPPFITYSYIPER